MAGRKVSIGFFFGRKDKIDSKHAPLGVLKEGRNLRVRKDGRLGMRNGYEPLLMTTPASALHVYDLHELNGRLIALGTSTSDGYPTDLWEYVGAGAQSAGVWRQTDPSAPRAPLGPFTNMRKVSGIPHPEGGVALLDSAAGAGYICLVYLTANGTSVNTLIVKQADDQTVLFERGGNNGLSQYTSAKVIFAGGKFLLMGTLSNNSVTILQFTPGTSGQWSAFATVDGASATAVSAFDLVAVGNPTTAAVATVYARGAASLIEIDVYTSAGASVGSTISVSAASSQTALEADQTADQITLLSFEGSAQLRTFDFAGNLDAGPTAISDFVSGQLVRVRFTNAGIPLIFVGFNNSVFGVTVNAYNPTTHALNFTYGVQNARLQTRMIDSSTGGSSTLDMVSWGGLIGPLIANNDFADATNALFTMNRSGGFQHVRRNPLNAKLVSAGAGLSIDSSTSRVLWSAAEDDGSELAMPSLALLDFKSSARRQSAKFAGLLYFAGATPLVYDSRFLVEPGFDFPGIISVTASNGAGALANNGVYAYVVHFEFTLSDGSIIQGPVSTPVEVTMGAADDTNTLVVQTPHCLPVSVAGSMFGADVTAVVSRTEWDSVTGTPGSVFRRSATLAVPTGNANYGEQLTIIDTRSDVSLASQAPVYTQAERGALSGPLPNQLQGSSSFLVATESRLVQGGLFDPEAIQVSKEAFRGEVFGWSEFSTFFSQVSAPVRGVLFLDQVKLVFTRDELYALFGEGPDDLGGSSRLTPPQRIPTQGGLQDVRTFLEVPEGVFFKLDAAKLFLLPRGAQSPVWEGQDIEDLLLAYPEIVGACKHKRDNAAVFACSNSGGTDGRLAVLDLRTRLWLTDTPPLETDAGITALVNYGDTLAYSSGGVVYVQTTGFADDGDDFIDLMLKTNPLYPFGLGGYGLIYECLLTAEFRGDCDLELRVSYDDGKNFHTLTSFSFTSAVYAVGDTIQKKWNMPQLSTGSVVLEWTVNSTGIVGATEGLVFNEVDLLVEVEEGLRELNPGDIG